MTLHDIAPETRIIPTDWENAIRNLQYAFPRIRIRLNFNDRTFQYMFDTMSAWSTISNRNLESWTNPTPFPINWEGVVIQ